MTQEEYKDLYHQALSIIHETIVGEPVLRPQGRRVEIDGQEYDDTDVVKIARGFCPDENWDAVDENHESRYRRALDCVRCKIIGWSTNISGKRAVMINGRPHYDDEVFVRAWGRDVAADIMAGRPPRY